MTAADDRLVQERRERAAAAIAVGVSAGVLVRIDPASPAGAADGRAGN